MPRVLDGAVDSFEVALGLSESVAGLVDSLLVAVVRAGHGMFELLSCQLESLGGIVQLLDQLIGDCGCGRIHGGDLLAVEWQRRCRLRGNGAFTWGSRVRRGGCGAGAR